MLESKCPKCGKTLNGLSMDYGFKWECSDCNTNDVLHAERGCVVRAVNLTDGYSYDEEIANHYLVKNADYTVERVSVGGWRTDVWLQEFPKIKFNSVHFKRIS
jgi:hypothetical protein